MGKYRMQASEIQTRGTRVSDTVTLSFKIGSSKFRIQGQDVSGVLKEWLKLA